MICPTDTGASVACWAWAIAVTAAGRPSLPVRIDITFCVVIVAISGILPSLYGLVIDQVPVRALPVAQWSTRAGRPCQNPGARNPHRSFVLPPQHVRRFPHINIPARHVGRRIHPRDHRLLPGRSCTLYHLAWAAFLAVLINPRDRRIVSCRQTSPGNRAHNRRARPRNWAGYNPYSDLKVTL